MTRRTPIRRGAGLLVVLYFALPSAVRGQPQAGPVANLQQRASALEAKTAELDAALGALRAEVRAKDNDLQAQIGALDGRIAAAETRLGEVEAALTAPDGVVPTLAARLAAIEQEVAELAEIASDLSLSRLDGSACVTPFGFSGSLDITLSRSGIATLRCRSGSSRFIDNLDGTVTDTTTKLMWEKKATPVGSGMDPASLHDVDNLYAWNEAIGDWLDRLNGKKIDSADQAGFAGYSDWRLPTVAELRTILDTAFTPFIDPVFGPTSSFTHWTSSIDASDTSDAWFVSFAVDGFIDTIGKDVNGAVRAVRREQ